MNKVCYPGTFDPLTYGHLDVIKRSAEFADELHILIADSLNKKTNFSVEERKEMIKLVTNDIPNVVIAYTDGLVVDYCLKNQIKFMIRGLRTLTDYEHEYALFYYNRNLSDKVETLILFPSSRNHFISSSSIKELVSHGADISNYVPAKIIPMIEAKLKKNICKN